VPICKLTPPFRCYRLPSALLAQCLRDTRLCETDLLAPRFPAQLFLFLPSQHVPGLGHFLKMPPIAPVRSEVSQPAAFLGTLFAFDDGVHESPPEVISAKRPKPG
jgi:hypothetical protein